MKIMEKIKDFTGESERIKAVKDKLQARIEEADELRNELFDLRRKLRKQEEEHQKEITRMKKELRSFKLVALAATDYDEKGIFPLSEEEAKKAVEEAVWDMANTGTFIRITAKPVQGNNISGFRFKVEEARNGSICW